MTGDPHFATVSALLRGDGACLQIGPFVVRLRSSLTEVARGVHRFYSRQILPDCPFADFHVALRPPRGARGFYRPQVRFFLDGRSPFKPLPRNQAFALFEWGLNWCIAQHAHHYLQIHAAVVARQGLALLLPGAPGSGKSTLCAALVARGWQLLSDEFALVCTETGNLSSLPRPISLKNESIRLIGSAFPHVEIGPAAYDTSKGTVAHMEVPEKALGEPGEPIRPAWIVFPRYTPDAPLGLAPISKGRTLLRIADSSFNYSVLGSQGFASAVALVDRCECHEMRFPGLDSGLASVERLCGGPP